MSDEELRRDLAATPTQRPLVEVAIDAAGGSADRAYTYAVPPALEGLEAGEAVLVEFGRRHALGIVLGPGAAVPGIVSKPIIDRVRTDGPLLPPRCVELARWIAGRYRAPTSLVIRAMLPPGMLERLELVVERTPEGESAGDDGHGDKPGMEALDGTDRELLDRIGFAPRVVGDLETPSGRAALIRRLRTLEASGRVTLDWTLTTAGAGPRFERRMRLTDAGRIAAANLAAGDRPPGRPLGPHQIELLATLTGERSTDGDRPTAGRGAGVGASTVTSLARRGLVAISVVAEERRPLARRRPGGRGARPSGSDLTGPQRTALDRIRTAIVEGDPTPLVLDGVTGGGKTAVYVESIAACLDAGRPVLILVPEVALALPLVDRLRRDLEAEIALVHSGLGEGERADEWRRIRRGEIDIVVGTRLAVVAPLAEVGLVIVDEEHDGAYKSDRTPRLQARDTAVAVARLAGAACVLGSATPAVETMGRVRDGTYRRVVLPLRPSGAPPTIEIVDLRAELAAGNRGLISRRLEMAIRDLRSADGERGILVINRRGSASVVLCRDCGAVQACDECARPLVFHQAGMSLRCHHCGRAAPLATRCPACGSPRIRYLGGGTQRVEAEVRSRFPGLRVGRLDRDVVERRGGAERVVDAFTDGRLDLLIGTSLVTKGFDIPEVALVGVVSADIALNLPDERSAERTYQLLTQAAGRAGRGDRPGVAIIQTYQPDHPAIRAVAAGDAAAFYDAELAARRRYGAPPFGRYVKLTVGLPDPTAAEAMATATAERLRILAAERRLSVEVIGPAPAYIARRAGRWRWNVVLRGTDPVALLEGGLGPSWSVDVDPETLL
ncbi:MAG: replication restart helicase PriA [Candidatus Limnocylindrales bacterium]